MFEPQVNIGWGTSAEGGRLLLPLILFQTTLELDVDSATLLSLNLDQNPVRAPPPRTKSASPGNRAVPCTLALWPSVLVLYTVGG